MNNKTANKLQPLSLIEHLGPLVVADWRSVPTGTGESTIFLEPSDSFSRLCAALDARDTEFLLVEYGHLLNVPDMS